ncbi:MAG: histidine kinase [Bacteroidetes bacterium]|nr:histidine kinase [Bacteroidota bacterium]
MQQSLILDKKPKGVFVFVDDDTDELMFLKEAVKALGLTNQVVCCINGLEALNYLKETEDEIFMIVSDLNMPKMDGLELKRMIEITPELKIKAIPFVFHSSTSRDSEIKSAYALNIQGFFNKAPTVEGTAKNLFKLFSVWTECVHPKDLLKFK